jgi:pyridoxal phosphate enzyme (YggS family)
MLEENLNNIRAVADRYSATLVAVSKTKSVEEIKKVYDKGIRHFGENYADELIAKQKLLPSDIHWHFIGHLQTNKAKLIAPFIYLIHSVDSIRLLDELEKQGSRCNRILKCLLQVHIAREETKFGIKPADLPGFLAEVSEKQRNHVQLCGLMGMATLTDDESVIRHEFATLKKLFNESRKQWPQFTILSMGMTSDYHIALEEGSNMIRIGSAIFGSR